MDGGGQAHGKGSEHPEDSDTGILRLRLAASPSPDVSN